MKTDTTRLTFNLKLYRKSINEIQQQKTYNKQCLIDNDRHEVRTIDPINAPTSLVLQLIVMCFVLAAFMLHKHLAFRAIHAF